MKRMIQYGKGRKSTGATYTASWDNVMPGGHLTSKVFLLVGVGVALMLAQPAWGQDIYASRVADPSVEESNRGGDREQSVDTLVPLSAAVERLPALRSRITIRVENEMLEEVLLRVAAKADLRLSYGSKMVEGKRVTLNRVQIPVHEAFQALLGPTTLKLMVSPSGQLVLTDRAKTHSLQSALGSTTFEHVTAPVLAAATIDNLELVGVQTGTIAGIVTDSTSGEPLPGVNVAVLGTQQGASTDGDGRYTISGVEVGTYTLQASFVGLATETVDGVEVFEGETTQVNFTLVETAFALEDVVVTALGVEREERALGYAVSRVETEDVTVNRTPNFMNALQGKIAGVNVSSMGTGPQGSSKVRIRGQSSFGANNSPLIVVDGVPIDNTTFGVSGDINERGSNRNSDSGDGLGSINPDNIESMTVLKGASAAALYGSRAKDGVIMITTKNRAQGTGIQLEYTSSLTTERPLDYRDYQMEYGQGEGGQRPTTSFPVSGVWSFGERFEPGMTQILFDGLEVPYEPQPNQLHEYYQNGSNLTNTVTVSSGWENGGLSISLSNLSSQSILPGSSYERNNIDLGFTQTVVDRLTLSGNVSYSREDRTDPPNVAEQDYSPVVIYTLANSMPMDVLEENCCNEDGDEIIYSRFTNRTNPYFALQRFENNIRDRVYGNLTARLSLTDWLFMQGRIGQDYYYRDQEYNRPTGSQREAPAPPGFVNGEYVQDQLAFREINADFLVNANRSFGDYGLNANIGGNIMHRLMDRKNVLVEDFYGRGLYSLANGRALDPQHSISERQVNSLYGSSEISYKDMVYLTGTV